jgi:hypothetical protein
MKKRTTLYVSEKEYCSDLLRMSARGQKATIGGLVKTVRFRVKRRPLAASSKPSAFEG